MAIGIVVAELASAAPFAGRKETLALIFLLANEALTMQWLPAGFDSLAYQSTDGQGFVCVEGRGETRVSLPDGSQTCLKWKPRDVFVVPGWLKHTHHAAQDAVVFGFSDRSAQEKLGLFRERRH